MPPWRSAGGTAIDGTKYCRFTHHRLGGLWTPSCDQLSSSAGIDCRPPRLSRRLLLRLSSMYTTRVFNAFSCLPYNAGVPSVLLISFFPPGAMHCFLGAQQSSAAAKKVITTSLLSGVKSLCVFACHAQLGLRRGEREDGWGGGGRRANTKENGKNIKKMRTHSIFMGLRSPLLRRTVPPPSSPPPTPFPQQPLRGWRLGRLLSVLLSMK